MPALTSELQAQDYYAFDNAWEHARHRLTLLEQCHDAGTIRRLRCRLAAGLPPPRNSCVFAVSR